MIIFRVGYCLNFIDSNKVKKKTPYIIHI